MRAPTPLEVGLAPGVRAAFTTRSGGRSRPPYDELNLALHVGDDPMAVTANRTAAASSLGIDPRRVVWADQVHGARAAVVDAGDAGRGGADLSDAVPGCDALVTDRAALPLAVLAADCVPLLLADMAGSGVAAVHAGRPGLVAGVVAAAVEQLAATGARPADVVAVLGPHIGACCYEVGDDVYDDVTAVLPMAGARSRAGRRSLDLDAGVRAELRRAGAGAVNAVGGCTSCDPARWYSYRRDGITGRHAGVIWRERPR